MFFFFTYHTDYFGDSVSVSALIMCHYLRLFAVAIIYSDNIEPPLRCLNLHIFETIKKKNCLTLLSLQGQKGHTFVLFSFISQFKSLK